MGPRTFGDTATLLAKTNPDVLYAAGVYSERADVIAAGLAAGCHVITDKPMCTTEADLDRIAETATAASGHLTLLLEKRVYPETRALFDLVSSGTLGTVVGISSLGPHKLNRSSRPGWFFDRKRYGGILNDLAVHDLDLSLVLMGDGPIEVSGRLLSAGRGGEPFARFGQATLSSPQCIASVHVDWLTPSASSVHGDYQMRVIGTAGVAELYWSRQELIVTTDVAPRRSVSLPPASRPAEPVLAMLLRGDRPEVDAVTSIRATRAALLAQRSAESGGESLLLPGFTTT